MATTRRRSRPSRPLPPTRLIVGIGGIDLSLLRLHSLPNLGDMTIPVFLHLLPLTIRIGSGVMSPGPEVGRLGVCLPSCLLKLDFDFLATLISRFRDRVVRRIDLPPELVKTLC
jgi:hypothetical protein